MSRILLLLSAAVLCAGVVGCQKIDEPAMPERNLTFVPLEGDAVPLEYGELVSATTVGSDPHQVVLWFRAEDQSVTAVRVNYSRGALMDRSLEIPRN